MKEGWKYVKLGEVATFTRGLTYSKNDEAVFSSKVVLRSNNIDLISGKLDFSELKYLKEDFEIPQDKIANKNSLIICMSNGSKIHLGKVALIDQDYGYAFGGFMGMVTPNQQVLPSFLTYAMSSPMYKDFIKSLSEGANINNIKFKDLNNYLFPLPPLSEQQQIVDFLDAEFAKIDELKNQAEQSLQNAKDLFQATLKEMLTPKEGWKECKMGNICELSQGLAINAKTRHLLVEKSSIPLLRIKDMKEGTREIFVDEKLFPPTCLANKEDLIYTRTGTLGLIFTGMYGILHNNCFKIKIVEKDINKSFYMYFVGSDSFRTQITKLASRAAQPDITHKLFKEQLFQYPSISEQRDIVNKLNIMQERITALQTNYIRTIQLCADLKQALLRQVFE